FLKKIVVKLSNQKKTYLDVGDTDGSVRLLFEKKYPELSLESLGINLQKQAVDNILKRGLKAECIDAMDLYKRGRAYNIVSVFETLEHLPNPIGFLENIHPIVKERLIISVPLIVNSRVGLRYLSQKWPKLQVPTIANNHIFELSPKDLTKIFWHTGWEVEDQWEVQTFPKHGPLRWLMQFAWRRISFEGWYFVSLLKNDKFASQYKIE
ncbi:MAG: class I SAM-dependent methyltransferase, partial [Proteobacteria bacterium]|nr:class I SAM-dependent methyltransferase [Pseudomonadota bacterium]